MAATVVVVKWLGSKYDGKERQYHVDACWNQKAVWSKVRRYKSGSEKARVQPRGRQFTCERHPLM